MAIARKAIILDLVEPHECGPKVDLSSLFAQPSKPDTIYDDQKRHQKSMPLEDPVTAQGPLDLLNKLRGNLNLKD
jgi:hypothetical protein